MPIIGKLHLYNDTKIVTMNNITIAITIHFRDEGMDSSVQTWGDSHDCTKRTTPR